jgi:TonB family protein
MNKYFTLILLLILSCQSVCFAQDDTIRIYYDKDWKKIQDPSAAAFYRKAYNNENGFWQVTDYYSDGKLQMTGVYLDQAMTKQQGPFEWFYPNGKLKGKATFMNGRAIDESFDYYDNGQIDTHTRYDNSGKQIERKYYKPDGSESTFSQAEYPGGMAEMYRFIGENMKYSRSLRKRGIEGRVFVSFNVNTAGKLYGIVILGAPHESMAAQAVRVVKAMPDWKPAERDGVKVDSKYNLPINFQLE